MTEPPSRPRQLGLFGSGEPDPTQRGRRRARAGAVGPAEVPAELQTLASRLPVRLRLGTSSWSFPGWRGLVYDRSASTATLARHGLGAYARHPLLRSVGIDRSYYAPLAAEVFAGYAAVVPDDFRFLVKAHEACTSLRLGRGPRGRDRRTDNPRFLDAAYASEEVVGPTRDGLGDKLGPLVFQFPPQDLRPVGGPDVFLERLHGFLTALPAGVLYAVEIRNADVLGHRYREVLAAAGAAACLDVHPTMPSIADQEDAVMPLRGPAVMVRWMLHPTRSYGGARDEFEPFDRLVVEDPSSRDAIATLCGLADAARLPAWVIVNNKAEGSAPWTIRRLAEAIVARRPG